MPCTPRGGGAQTGRVNSGGPTARTLSTLACLPCNLPAALVPPDALPAHIPSHLNSLQSVSEPMRGRLSGTRPLLLAAAWTACSVVSGLGAGAAPVLLALPLLRSSPTISGCGVGVKLLLPAAATSGCWAEGEPSAWAPPNPSWVSREGAADVSSSSGCGTPLLLLLLCRRGRRSKRRAVLCRAWSPAPAASHLLHRSRCPRTLLLRCTTVALCWRCCLVATGRAARGKQQEPKAGDARS